jgi:dTDP-D-glucose 4,6-dehydratase
MLGWSPTWDFETTIAKTVAWYTDPRWNRSAEELTLEQIAAYEQDATATGNVWVN